MDPAGSTSIGRRVLGALGACLTAACASNAPYHTTSEDGGACRTDPDSPACRSSAYQEFERFDLAFAEFSERGNAFDDAKVEAVLAKIAAKARADGVVLIVFVHGWKHNASEDDPNVLSFKDSLETMTGVLGNSFAGTALGTRRLVGVYVGWRGASIGLPLLKELTFWDRKAVAEELGSGGVTRLLLDLDRITAGEARNVMVVVGHSFGGAIVVRALSDLITERVTNRADDESARVFGDGVLVLNPAIEANQALPFVEAALQRPYARDQLPLFISISSDADAATHYAFPAGQTIGLATWRQTDLQRSYYHDRRTPEQPLPLRERHLDATTAGNFAPFLTHRLRASGQDGAVNFELTRCDAAPEQCTPKGWTTLSGQPTIGPLPADYPLYFVKTDKSVMADHNDIFNQQVRSFVFTVIDDVVRRSLRETKPADAPKALAVPVEPPLIADPGRFTARMNQIWKVVEPKVD
ncbi:MAG TPA: hypothetical protein PKZ27_14725 [Rhodocyclaceae bacterium]|nr:hypothetical protein [Rhodocyclaceae bacterium]